jgi:hypothetical protein
MARVEIYEYDNDARRHLAGTVVIEDGHVVYKGVPPQIVKTMRSGVRAFGKLLQPKHGMAFLKALPILFDGQRVKAKLFSEE